MVAAEAAMPDRSGGRMSVWRVLSLQRHPALAALAVAVSVWLLLLGNTLLSVVAGLLLSCEVVLLLATSRILDTRLARAEDDGREARVQLETTRSGLASALRRMSIIESDLPGLLFERRVCENGHVTYPFFGGNLLSVLGLTPDQARNDPCRVLSCIHSDDRRRWDLLQRASEHACAGYADTFRIVGQSGEVFWAKCIANAQPDGTGGMLWTGLWIDVSAQQAAREAADRSSKAKGTLLATVSHEIRTPLNAIIGFNDLLLEKLSSPQERRYAALTRDAGAMLLRLVDQILVLSKAEHGRAAAREIPFSLSGLMSGSAALVAPMTQKNGLDVTLATAPDVPDRLAGDPEKLQQVLVNLLSNAAKFSSNGTVAVWATRLDHHEREIRLRFAVTDTGCGIPADTLGDLFKPFAQASPQTGWEFGGTGLGLAICGELVQQMGGRIGATSRPGAGSTFWFEVRLAISAEVEEICPPLAAPAETAIVDIDAARPARILVADDVALNRELLATILESEGHSVHTVRNGAEAVQAVISDSFDLVFMDVQMPVMSGLEATRAIRDSAGTMSSVPIVAITADALDMSLERCRLAGMDAHLLKPLKKLDLLRAVSTWSGRKALCRPPLGEVADPDASLGNEALDGLASRLGRERVFEFLEEFVAHLAEWNRETDGIDAFAKDVHRLLGSSGQLGFESLSRSCRQFLTRYHDAPGSDLSAAEAELRHAVDGALAHGKALLRKPLPRSITTALGEPECVPC